jgi:hypothetical protein
VLEKKEKRKGKEERAVHVAVRSAGFFGPSKVGFPRSKRVMKTGVNAVEDV